MSAIIPHPRIFTALQTIGGLNPSVHCEINYQVKSNIHIFTKGKNRTKYVHGTKCFVEPVSHVYTHREVIKTHFCFFLLRAVVKKFENHYSHLRTAVTTVLVSYSPSPLRNLPTTRPGTGPQYIVDEKVSGDVTAEIHCSHRKFFTMATFGYGQQSATPTWKKEKLRPRSKALQKELYRERLRSSCKE